jgi:sirohydrochlorin ferrochelatase
MQRIILVDNGSRRADAVLNLNRLAKQLSQRSGKTIDAVPLQHADKIPSVAFGDALGGKPVITFPAYVRNALTQGVDEFVILPLFFGHSRAISSFIPDTLNGLQKAHGKFNWRIADVLCPLPGGEPELARLLYENLEMSAHTPLGKLDYIILTDHGSPSRQVNDVRVKLAEQLAPYLPAHVPLLQAAMERREGPEYDFNGPLLQDLLEQLARESGAANVAISMLFISPGRHAGEGGDIAGICDQAMQRHPGLAVHVSPLVGDSPLLIEILFNRLRFSHSSTI